MKYRVYSEGVLGTVTEPTSGGTFSEGEESWGARDGEGGGVVAGTGGEEINDCAKEMFEHNGFFY